MIADGKSPTKRRVRADYGQMLVLEFGVPLAMLPPVLPPEATRGQQLKRTAKLRRMYETHLAYRKAEEAKAARLIAPMPKCRFVPSPTDIAVKRVIHAKTVFEAWAKSQEGSAANRRMPDEVMILLSYDLYLSRCRAEGRDPLPNPST